jgi:hypothetical protein
MLRSPRILVLLAALGALLLGAGCRFDEPVEIPFFLEHEPDQDRVDDTVPILFSGWETDAQRDEVKVWALWPVWRYAREGREVQSWLFGVPVYRNRIDHRGFDDLDLIAGPVFYGHSPDEGSYLTVFPFGGTMRGLLGKSYAMAVLFPVFLYMEDDCDRDFKSYHVLFPFVNWWEGGGRSGGRVWPFYAHYERRDVGGRLAYRRTWILWPFWQTLENNLNSVGGEQKMWFLFPFYGRGDGPQTHQWTVMWPFFKYYENRGSAFGGPLWEVRAPFPFVHIVRGRDRTLTDIWPLFGVKERGIDYFTGPGHEYYKRHFVLWPIWHDETHVNGDTRESRWWALPLLWSFHTENEVDRTEKDEFKVWPLFRYKRWADGRVAVNVISPLWFQDPEGAFERIYGPLTRVWHEWRDPDEGSRRMELLWGLFGRREYVSPEKEDVKNTSFLFGLFQVESRDEKTSLRFFYLPQWPTWGEEKKGPPAKGEKGMGTGGQRTPG